MNRILAALGCALAASLACNLPVVSGEPPSQAETVQTSVAGTLIAQLTQTAASGPATEAPPLSEAPVSTPEPLPTASATPTPTITPTPTPSVPSVSVTVNTNCRAGPGAVYDYLGALLVGETAEIVGRDPAGNYWFIQNPDNPGGFCWLWGEYAQPVGNFGSLPILTPPPSPTPSPVPPAFNLDYSNLHDCGGLKYATFRVENSGGVVFESANIHVQDLTASANLYGPASSNAPFNPGSGDCPPGASSLDPGDVAYIAVSIGAAPPSGNDARGTITLCTQDGLGGDCVSRSADFVIP